MRLAWIRPIHCRVLDLQEGFQGQRWLERVCHQRISYHFFAGGGGMQGKKERVGTRKPRMKRERARNDTFVPFGPFVRFVFQVRIPTSAQNLLESLV
jgi:hypothetical protein